MGIVSDKSVNRTTRNIRKKWKIQFFLGVIGYVFLIIGFNQIELTSPITGWIGGERLIELTTQQQGIYRFGYLIIGRLIWSSLNLLINRFLSRWVWHTGKKYVGIISSIGVVASIYVLKQLLDSFNVATNFLTYIFIGLFVMVSFFAYFIIRYKALEQEQIEVRERNKIMEEKYNQLSQHYISRAKLYHDMDGHLKAIYHMAQKGKNDEIAEYIKGLDEMPDHDGMTVWTGVDIIDSILSEKEKAAKEQGIHVEIEAEMIPVDMVLQNWEVCSLFSNLLNNCIEAKPTEIKVLVKIVGQMLLIQTINDYKEEPVKINGQYQTSKKEKDHHGWGMKRIEDIVEKYNGSVETKNENGIFYVNIILNIY